MKNIDLALDHGVCPEKIDLCFRNIVVYQNEFIL